jgi:hypothetical protein
MWCCSGMMSTQHEYARNFRAFMTIFGFRHAPDRVETPVDRADSDRWDEPAVVVRYVSSISLAVAATPARRTRYPMKD